MHRPVRIGRFRVLVLPVVLFSSCGPAVAYEGSQFADVVAELAAEPYATLPRLVVDGDVLGTSGEDPGNRLRLAARRTLTASDDLVDFPGGRKLIQPNGICFSGTWSITAGSPYTGLLAGGARALAVARASVALSETTRGHRRAFAVAVKLFPTLDPDERVRTANFFTLVSVVGSRADHFLDEALDNEPTLGGLPAFADIGLGLRIQRDLEAVDGELSPGGSDVRYRPLTPVAAAGLAAGTSPVAPRWVRLAPAPGLPRVDEADFRDELRLARYPDRVLVYQVHVADGAEGEKSFAAWRRIGTLRLDRDYLSRGCDGRLHFAHPRIAAG